ncbi:MAG: hypothetical protein HY961_15445, partial [Ignavibacteriae bacterium]|nr:hypothetical protein [Ignavibacteriota bacterium]
MFKVCDEAVALILQHEGLNQPDRWPGGFSGITIGIGYDLGYVTVDQFESDWGSYISRLNIDKLRVAVGLRGMRAKNKAEEFVGTRIRRVDAEQVFTLKTLPLFAFRANQAFPCFDKLPEKAQGALVSLVYNRGTSMVDRPGEDRRKEMRAIRDAVVQGDLSEIAAQLR